MVTVKLISAFVFATWIVQSLFYLNTKFQVTSHLLALYRFVSDLVGNPEDRFSHNEAHMDNYHSKRQLKTDCIGPSMSRVDLRSLSHDVIELFMSRFPSILLQKDILIILQFSEYAYILYEKITIALKIKY